MRLSQIFETLLFSFCRNCFNSLIFSTDEYQIPDVEILGCTAIEGCASFKQMIYQFMDDPVVEGMIPLCVFCRKNREPLMREIVGRHSIP